MVLGISGTPGSTHKRNFIKLSTTVYETPNTQHDVVHNTNTTQHYDSWRTHLTRHLRTHL